MNNRKWILKEILRIDAIENELDKKTQRDKLVEIIEKINELNWLEHERQYCMLQQYINQYLWHGFSYGKAYCISKSKARRALINHKKNEVFVFYQHNEAAYIYKNASKLKASDFDMDDDVYVVDKDFQWTYVKTHETMCGPYFAKSN